MRTFVHRPALLAAFCALAAGAHGQSPINFTNNLGNGLYDANNWEGGPPPSAGFAEVGVIGSGALPTAVASIGTPVSTNPGGLTLGGGVGNSGTLNITPCGSLQVVSGGPANGTLVVGGGGNGTLAMTGGTLSAQVIDTNGASSAVRLSGAATLTSAGATTLGATTRITGPTVNFSSAGDLTLEASHTLIAEINAATHSPLKSQSNAFINGALNVEFVPGFSGTSWVLVDAQNVIGSFNAINITGGPTLESGQFYGTRQGGSGANGATLELFLDQRLTLAVNRDTGQVSIKNPGSSVTVNIDAYTVFSPGDAIAEGAWNSLHDQGGGAPAWTESNPTANRLSELRAIGSEAIGPAGQRTLGAIYAPTVAGAFGDTSYEDLSFSYRNTAGATITGAVEYTGTTGINNLTLVVDPATGNAQLRNTSMSTVKIDAYAVKSAAGSLDATDPKWNSLDQQGIDGNDWRESNASANLLAELKAQGTTELSPGEAYNLGQAFVPGAVRDLDFTFRAVPVALAGDYNSDGAVDTADYTVWRDGLGTTFVQSDYDAWKNNFGMTGGGAPITYSGVVTYGAVPPLVIGAIGGGAVPEPGGALLALAGVVGVWMARRWA
ncbi:hypothetical protein Pla175_14000 [Pirellulimonas nuda]|uniref:Autotransporter-associated beta strand repeat protein n=1 Tax=Pirellulimonas nuda TaxID=2528009 RepID=A0A518D997_9BACT|nr:hypothetical protein [Pirellulimonas nuda]QDU88030.1 hypothetical protein Pla175_14000 [Pirellulimonas nuda]